MTTPHELDFIIVKNIDINCTDEDSETGYSHKDYFEVKWDGIPHQIVPGEEKRMPRFLAEHFAKHLTDHILQKREQQTGKKNLVNNPVERPRVLRQIFVKIDQYYQKEASQTEGQKVKKMVDNYPQSIEDIQKQTAKDTKESKKVPSVSSMPPEKTNPVKKSENPKSSVKPQMIVRGRPKSESETSLWDSDKKLPSLKELKKDAEHLGINVRGDETQEELAQKIKAF